MKLPLSIRCLALIAGLALAAVAGGCVSEAGPDTESEPNRIVRPVSAEFDQRVVVPTSALQFHLLNTDRVVAERATITLAGVHCQEGRLVETYDAQISRIGDVGDIIVVLPVAEQMWADVAADGETSFDGTIEIELIDALGPVVRSRVDSVHLEFVWTLEPVVETFSVGDIFANERIPLAGSGFLRPEEGTTWAIFESGTVTTADGDTRDLSGERVALEWVGERGRAEFPADPGVFGVRVAQFEARVRLSNELRDADTIDGVDVRDLSGNIEQSFIARLSPEAGSRGQKIGVIGRGLVPTDGEAGFGMLLRYEGRFLPDDPDAEPIDLTGANALLRPPDHVDSEQRAEQSVWYTIHEDRTLSGLGRQPGVFEGRITPELFDRWGDQEGIAWEGDFRVLPTKQVVYLKYLPAFSKGLEKYGLRNVEREIRDRIFEVVSRDYRGVNVEFREEEPDDFIDYATVELGGPDPSGRNAFGYDNTFNGVAKDTGNLFLADYLGGVNVDSDEQFNNPYGGVFIESFAIFSPTLSGGHPYSSPHFDRILGPFMPALDGEPVKGTEWPDGPRREAITEAIRMVGSVIGNTVSHELGHSMGLTYFPGDEQQPGDRFHNQVTGPYIMDPGSERPFAERAEIDGEGPAQFNERNSNYLQRHLPLPE